MQLEVAIVPVTPTRGLHGPCAMSGCAPGVRRILVINDNPMIREDLAKILSENGPSELRRQESLLFGSGSGSTLPIQEFETKFVFQSQEALHQVQQSMVRDNPCDLAFVDMRMPSGWDGLEIVVRLRRVDPEIHIVVCSAGSDEFWHEMSARLARNDQLLMLKKSFDAAEVSQMASTFTEKRHLQRMRQKYTRELEKAVRSRTAPLMKAHEETIHILMRASVHRDAETGNHIRRVGWFSARLARAACRSSRLI